MGCTYLFIALWILSIFGNYDADSWYNVSQARLLPWGLLFAAAAGVCIFISLKTDDAMLQRLWVNLSGDQSLYPLL